MKKNFRIILLSAFISIVFYACNKPLIASYDQYAYTQATSLKVDIQNLIQKSDSVKYTDAADEINRVTVEIQKAYEYSKGRSQNSISTKQYEILLSDADFYKKFLSTWKAQGTESPTAASEASIKAGQLIDKIIELENGKNKPQ